MRDLTLCRVENLSIRPLSKEVSVLTGFRFQKYLWCSGNVMSNDPMIPGISRLGNNGVLVMYLAKVGSHLLLCDFQMLKAGKKKGGSRKGIIGCAPVGTYS